MTNQTILHGLKTRLNEVRGLWVEELHSVLWAYRTTPRVSIRESPFNLTYGTEAMIPLEIGLPSTRVEQYCEPGKFECWRADLDLLPELRCEAQLCIASYRQRVARYYNVKVKPRFFRPGDLVLKKAEVDRKSTRLNSSHSGESRMPSSA